MLKTEMRNPSSMHIDQMDTLSMMQLINQENRNAVDAIDQALESIAKVCDIAAETYAKGGRIFYIGAGSSGRLGVLDAAECPPTYGVAKDRFIGIIAGGEKCLTQASENQEDLAVNGMRDLEAYELSDKDLVIGISAAGGAQYVIGALTYANEVGAYTVSLSNNADTPIEQIARTAIIADTGAEVITGSTRMKAGTAQKIILNMISTGAMVKAGMVYENMMVNLKPTNIKLKDRVIRIVCEILHCEYDTAQTLLEQNDWNIRTTIEKEAVHDPQ